MNKIKIGLLLDSNLSNSYILDLADWAQQQADIEISHRILCPPASSPRKFKINKVSKDINAYLLFTTLLFKAIVSFEKIILKFSRIHRRHFDLFDLREKINGELTINPIIEKSCCHFSKIDVERVKSLNLDLIIKCNSCAIRGEIIHASRLGIISLNNGIDHIRPENFACFWESYYRMPKTAFTIHKLTDDSEIGETLISGFFSTKYFFSLNQANLLRKSMPHLKNLIKKISISGQLPKPEINDIICKKIFQAPKFHQCMAYLFKVNFRLATKIILHCVNIQKKWQISFVNSNWDNAILSRGISANAPKGHFWADPFVYSQGDRTYCFVEDYEYKTSRGHISVLEIVGNSVIELGECIRESTHLSFPFLFRYEESLYMCPESSESGKIKIYRSKRFPFDWELSSIAMENVFAADTMLFEHAGSWWMLTSIDESGSNDYCSELYLFYSNSPLDSNWKAHPKNPIRIDSDGGRNAGLILENGKIFRLAQRQGYDQYGEGLLIYEITQLSKSIYSEKLISEIDPSFKNGILGSHHLSTTGRITAFDHKSHSFFP